MNEDGDNPAQAGAAQATAAQSRAAKVIAECRLIGTMSEEPGRTTRRFLTPPVAAVHAHLRKRMEALGMRVYVDPAGNLRGVWRPGNAARKRLLLGSHIDTVPNAGCFDGVLGVVLGIAWVQLAQELGLPIAIEIIAFSEEEGVRYGVPFLGSRAVAGSFNMKALAYKDAQGIHMYDAIRSFGLDPTAIPAAALSDAEVEEEISGYLEMHIEQGPVLESEGLPLAVVEGIVGQSRLNFRFTGRANHAGTTPMHLRRDALAAAAEWIRAVEAAAQTTAGLVATVGRISVEPDADNVIPGVAQVSLDVRHMSNRVRNRTVKELSRCGQVIAARRGLVMEQVEKMNERSVAMDAELSAQLMAAIEAAGFAPKILCSGAGHDAMIMAKRMPAAMLFLRTPGGISHHPEENVLEEDVEAAIQVGQSFLQRMSAMNYQ
jgi:allantoate deiminase